MNKLWKPETSHLLCCAASPKECGDPQVYSHSGLLINIDSVCICTDTRGAWVRHQIIFQNRPERTTGWRTEVYIHQLGSGKGWRPRSLPCWKPRGDAVTVTSPCPLLPALCQDSPCFWDCWGAAQTSSQQAAYLSLPASPCCCIFSRSGRWVSRHVPHTRKGLSLDLDSKQVAMVDDL